MQPEEGPGGLAVRPGRFGQGLGRAADHDAPGPPRRQHVIDYQGDMRVVLRVAELPGPREVPAADVDHVQAGVVVPAQGHNVRHPGGVDGREPAEPAVGQVGQLGLREHAHLAPACRDRDWPLGQTLHAPAAQDVVLGCAAVSP